MKVRLNKHRLLFNLKWNNYWNWKIDPYITKARRLQKCNERRKKLLDAL